MRCPKLHLPGVANHRNSERSPAAVGATYVRKELIMSISPIMAKVAEKLQRKDIPQVSPGDTVRVQVKIKEGDKERLQAFEGVVIAKKSGPQASLTVHKISFGQGVERIFPLNSKVIDKIEHVRSSRVRRAKLFYLRGLRGKAARLRETERGTGHGPSKTPAADEGAQEG